MYTEKRTKKMEKRRETMVNPLSLSFFSFFTERNKLTQQLREKYLHTGKNAKKLKLLGEE